MARSSGRPPLQRSTITAAALQLLDETGVEGFRMRELARRLGVDVSSLYHHVPDRQAVLMSVQAVLLLEVPPPATGARWQESLRDGLRHYRQVALRHPHAASLLTNFTLGEPEASARVEEYERLVAGSGLDGDDLAMVMRACVSFADGLINRSVIGNQGRSLTDPAFEFGLDALIEAIEQLADRRRTARQGGG
ncbi:MAG: TetR/AcrR family transcriptional regulator [Phycicoccus sp.]